MPLTCQTLIDRHSQLWHQATHHPFLEQCKTGAIAQSQFNTWLVQDYLFVLEFTRMAARLVTLAPVADMDGLLGGLGALKDELEWFQAKAAQRHLSLAAEPQPTCETYCIVMKQLAGAPYAIQAVAFWAIELAYNQGWQLPGPMVEPYDEFANRWGNPGFTAYVKLLEQQADAALEALPESDWAKAEAIFVKVAELENEFWQMAFNA
ncbi:MAG: TenA family transcriptional regulator [Cyanobacteria bacterium P01_D01_bin.128]